MMFGITEVIRYIAYALVSLATVSFLWLVKNARANDVKTIEGVVEENKDLRKSHQLLSERVSRLEINESGIKSDLTHILIALTEIKNSIENLRNSK